MGRKYPSEMRKRARRLVRMGSTKMDVSRMMKVSYNTLYTWTKDLRKRKGQFGIRGRSLELLKILVERGCILSSDEKYLAMRVRTLKKYLPMRRVKIKKNVVWYLAGREREAMEAMMKSMNRMSVSYQELGRMRRVFGIKNIKGKIRL